MTVTLEGRRPLATEIQDAIDAQLPALAATLQVSPVRITISADGSDADAALTALCQLVESGFGEDTWNA